MVYNPKYVSTSKPTKFDERGEDGGVHFIMSPETHRTFGSHGYAIDHATNLIQRGDCEEFLIVRVVGRVRKKPIPVEYIKVEE